MAKSTELTVKKKKGNKSKEIAAKIKSPSIPYSNDDYLIVRDDKNRLRFGVALSSKRLLLEEGIERDETMQQIEFKNKDVVANLGKTPIVGKQVYGIGISPFLGNRVHKNFGQVNLYTELEDKDVDRLFKSLDRCWKVMKEMKTISSFPMTAIRISKPSGNSAGKYKIKKQKSDELYQEMSFNIIDYKDKTHLDRTVLTVVARATWMNQVPEDLQLEWTKLYHQHLVLRTINDKQLKDILYSISVYAQENEYGDITAYTKSVCDDEDTLVIKAILRHIRSVHRIDAKQLDRLVMIDPDFLETVWPTQIDMSRARSEVSLAAEKSVQDMFCECFAINAMGTKLPKQFRKLMKKTLAGLSKKFSE